MKKSILIFAIIIEILFFACSSKAKMETKSLSIGGTAEENESSIQTILKKEVEPPDESKQITPVEVNNYIDLTPPYNYYPYPANYYSRTIGPYGVYTNIGSFGFNYSGHSFSYGMGSNRYIYVNPPSPPPPPPPPNGHRPPMGHGPHPPGGSHPPNGSGHGHR